MNLTSPTPASAAGWAECAASRSRSPIPRRSPQQACRPASLHNSRTICRSSRYNVASNCRSSWSARQRSQGIVRTAPLMTHTSRTRSAARPKTAARSSCHNFPDERGYRVEPLAASALQTRTAIPTPAGNSANSSGARSPRKAATRRHQAIDAARLALLPLCRSVAVHQSLAGARRSVGGMSPSRKRALSRLPRINVSPAAMSAWVARSGCTARARSELHRARNIKDLGCQPPRKQPRAPKKSQYLLARNKRSSRLLPSVPTRRRQPHPARPSRRREDGTPRSPPRLYFRPGIPSRPPAERGCTVRQSPDPPASWSRPKPSARILRRKERRQEASPGAIFPRG